MQIFKCLHCQADIEDEYPIIGDIVTCPECGTEFFFANDPEQTGELILEYS